MWSRNTSAGSEYVYKCTHTWSGMDRYIELDIYDSLWCPNTLGLHGTAPGTEGDVLVGFNERTEQL